MENMLIVGSIILILAIFARKISLAIGSASMVLFCLIGVVLQPLGHFMQLDSSVAQGLGGIALALMLFYGGYRVDIKKIKGVFASSFLLSTLGVVLTALCVALFMMLLGFDFLQGLLVGSLIASTDTASVFTIIQGKKLQLPDRVETVLDLESGSNDPFAYMMAVFTIALITHDRGIPITLFIVQQLIVGVVFALIVSFALSKLFNMIHFEVEAFYPLLLMTIVLLIFGLTSYLNGNGLLAVYVAGVTFKNNTKPEIQIKVKNFFESLSWVLHSLLFVLMGLFVKLNLSVLPIALVVGLLLIFVIRPVIVFLLLSLSSFKPKEKMAIGVIGIRGAAAIVFALGVVNMKTTYVEELYNMVFYIVLLSVLIHERLINIIVSKLKL